MRILFIHPVFPGQFHRVMQHLAAEPGNEVLHISRQSAHESVPGVKRLRYAVPDGSAPSVARSSKTGFGASAGTSVVIAWYGRTIP